MNLKDLAPTLKQAVAQLENLVPYASAFAGKSGGRNAHVSLYNKQIGFTSPNTGVVFTAFTGSQFIENATNDLTKAGLQKAVAELEQMIKAAEVNPNGLTIDPGEKLEKDFEVPVQQDPESLSAATMLEMAGTNVQKLKNMATDLANGGVTVSYAINNELFVNRNKVLYQDITRCDYMYFAVFRKGNNSAQCWNGQANQGGAEHYNIDEEEMRKTLADGHQLLIAPRIEPGYYDCIFTPEMSGMFAHEAFGHGTETDMYLKGRAKGYQYMNKQVAAPAVNMFDSPAYLGQSGSFFFDHEGHLAVDTQIIKDGILVSGLTDTNSAIRLGYKPTPNSRRQNWAHKVYARMTNTYFATGNNTLDEMIASIKNGYLVGYPSNGMEDPKGWGIQLESLMARQIIDGKLTNNYFTPIIVTGYVPDLLNSISMIGKDLVMAGLGMCGKGHKEWVKVSDGGPYLKLKARLA